jgi:hypothetical protein
VTSAICRKEETLLRAQKKLTDHLKHSTQAAVTQNGIGPNTVLKKPPMEKIEIHI